jgi:hypothetical protein
MDARLNDEEPALVKPPLELKVPAGVHTVVPDPDEEQSDITEMTLLSVPLLLQLEPNTHTVLLFTPLFSQLLFMKHIFDWVLVVVVSVAVVEATFEQLELNIHRLSCATFWFVLVYPLVPPSTELVAEFVQVEPNTQLLF